VLSFFYRLYGVENGRPLIIPLYSCLRQELIYSLEKPMNKCFKDLIITAENLSAILPKLGNYIAILFKYQNKDLIMENI
jgi:hypothetical protein